MAQSQQHTQQSTGFALGTRISNYEIINVLGEGAYGRVYLAKQIDSRNNRTLAPKLYAIKSLRQGKLDDRQRAFQRTEIGLHTRLSASSAGRHIVRLERVVHEPGWVHMIMEYGPEGDLFSAITERNLYIGNHRLIRDVFLQLIDAVSHCHTHSVYHRDLKPENILVFDDGKTVKLADFGLATTHAVSNEYGCGSTFYFSPECQGDMTNSSRKKRIGYATAPNDVWSLGVILINLTTGRNPWRQASLSDETFCAYLADPDFLLQILPISRELNQILKRIFCVDPLRRIGLDELRERIKRCKHFTRTHHVERLEMQQDLARDLLPPSPPATPRRSQSSSWIAPSPSSSSSTTTTTTTSTATFVAAYQDHPKLPMDSLVPDMVALSV